MSGNFTRRMYDSCAIQQNVKQSTDPLELMLDVTKYVHCNNICRPANEYPPNAALLVDVESSLWGIDKLSSKCDSAKHPFCGPNGCLLTNDSRVAPHITPYACERGHTGENAVVTTNMQMPRDPGYRLPNTNVCSGQGNGYYVDPARVQQNIPQHVASQQARAQVPVTHPMSSGSVNSYQNVPHQTACHQATLRQAALKQKTQMASGLPPMRNQQFRN